MLNIKNRTIFCKDNLDVLQGINNKSVDLIYLDPPFNKNKTFTAPIGSSAESASFKDYFREEDIKDEWVETIKEDHIELYNFLNGVKSISNSKHYLYNYCYLCYMAIRLIEMRKILKDTGSIYFHCDPTMSHYIKIMMDTIFGEDNFRNEIVWKRTWDTGAFKKRSFSFASLQDIIIFYSKDEKQKNNFNIQYDPYPENYEDRFKQNDNDGKGFYYWADLNKPSKNSIERLRIANEVKQRSSGKWSYKRYIERVKENNVGIPIGNMWNDINRVVGRESTGYPTQKPLSLLERIIKASSKEGDVILDPFCGCATTCIASEKLNRKWVGIDISVKAYELVKERLNKEVEGKFDFDLPRARNTHGIKVHFSTDSPKRTDRNKEDRLKKYVYIISHPKFEGYYKVGIAKDYKTRLNSYQTSDPDRAYKMEYFYLTPHFRETEKYIHNLFDNKFEWIKANLKDIVQKIENYN